LQTLESYMILI